MWKSSYEGGVYGFREDKDLQKILNDFDEDDKNTVINFLDAAEEIGYTYKFDYIRARHSAQYELNFRDSGSPLRVLYPIGGGEFMQPIISLNKNLDDRLYFKVISPQYCTFYRVHRLFDVALKASETFENTYFWGKRVGTEITRKDVTEELEKIARRLWEKFSDKDIATRETLVESPNGKPITFTQYLKEKGEDIH